jgi:Family of unknown function (DUF6496)
MSMVVLKPHELPSGIMRMTPMQRKTLAMCATGQRTGLQRAGAGSSTYDLRRRVLDWRLRAGLSTTFASPSLMAKYGRAASKRVKSAMHRKKKGTLKSGSGRKVKSRKQAIAIALSEAREKGGKVPRRQSSRKKR